jgi:hypothetical protein
VSCNPPILADIITHLSFSDACHFVDCMLIRLGMHLRQDGVGAIGCEIRRRKHMYGGLVVPEMQEWGKHEGLADAMANL